MNNNIVMSLLPVSHGMNIINTIVRSRTITCYEIVDVTFSIYKLWYI